MAITPKTLIKSPAVLLGASLSIIAIGALGASMFSVCDRDLYVEEVANFQECSHLASNAEVANWNEGDFVKVAFCYEDLEMGYQALDVAEFGLGVYPKSETLHNIRGYHLIDMGEYEQAVHALTEGVNRVNLTNGIMENNLSWASLWVPREMPLEQSRTLYQSALKRNVQGINCEAVHTGMWVEYAIAASGSEHVRQEALKRYDGLRDQYDGCEKRLSNGTKHVIEEVMGAAVLDVEVAKLQTSGQRPAWARAHSGLKLTKEALQAVQAHQTLTLDEVCTGATPVAGTQHTCERLVSQAIRCNKR